MFQAWQYLHHSAERFMTVYGNRVLNTKAELNAGS